MPGLSRGSGVGHCEESERPLSAQVPLPKEGEGTGNIQTPPNPDERLCAVVTDLSFPNIATTAAYLVYIKDGDYMLNHL